MIPALGASHASPGSEFLASVLALTIVDYEDKPVFDQIRATQTLCNSLTECLKAESDRAVVIDREDGAQVCFLNTPKDCLAAVTRLVQAFRRNAGQHALALKLGVNLGPVRFARDAFGNVSLMGAGVDDACLAQDQAEPGELLVSRSFFAVLSRSAPELARCFKYKGPHHISDTNVLALYVMHDGHSLSPQAAAPARIVALRREHAPTIVSPAPELATVEVLAPAWESRPSLFKARLRQVVRLGVAAALATYCLTFIDRPWVESTPAHAPRAQTGQSLPTLSPLTVAPQAVTMHTLPPSPAPAALEPVTPTEESSAPPPGPAPGRIESVAADHRATLRKLERKMLAATRAQPKARLQFAVRPWGEIYLDGKKVGVSPPLKRLEVRPGRYTLTVRNSTLPTYEALLDVVPDQSFLVVHEFR